MQISRSGIGSKKHGISGKTSKSPKVRLSMKLEAERNEIKAKQSTCKHQTIKDLMDNK
jgi:hypothetical protein